MVGVDVINRVRRATCAIGYLIIPLKDYLPDRTRPAFEVLGTGFLVRETTVMTNRHIIKAIERQISRGTPEHQFFLQFIYEDGRGGLQGALARMQSRGAIMNPEWDIGFIEFQSGDPDFAQVNPLAPAEPWQATVTEEIAACGYPYGTAMLERDTTKIYRFGPVVQQGYISAIAPYDTATKPTELLLDLRVAGGMSGSPVFRPLDGGLLGIVFASWEATTALALPVRGPQLGEWLRLHDTKA